MLSYFVNKVTRYSHKNGMKQVIIQIVPFKSISAKSTFNYFHSVQQSEIFCRVSLGLVPSSPTDSPNTPTPCRPTYLHCLLKLDEFFFEASAMSSGMLKDNSMLKGSAV